jgi:hypothetical protein
MTKIRDLLRRWLAWLRDRRAAPGPQDPPGE